VLVTILLGPTASGKTAVSLCLAEQLGAEIVCLDSRQVFSGMAIGTAQPTAEERARVPHHLFGCLDPDERFSAGDYGRLARKTLAGIEARGKPALFVGGSGLYLRALEGGLAEDLPHDEMLRRRLREKAAAIGSEALHAELKEKDAITAARLHPNDTQRITRALEIIALAGKPLSRLLAFAEPVRREFIERRCIVVLGRVREDLYRRIDERTGWLLDNGMIEEVRDRLAGGMDRNLPVFKAHGYPEVAAFLEGKLDRAGLQARLAQVTRNYAKRQLTWFRKIDGAHWLSVPPGEPPEETAARALTLTQHIT
jgi:tRNA dimethylallyltransferase